MQHQQPDWYRLHYCGTCKALGKSYGQRSRPLLNFDCVFLAEILSLIQQEDTTAWHDDLQGKACFTAPDSADIPISLQYAADVNMIVAFTNKTQVYQQLLLEFAQLPGFAR